MGLFWKILASIVVALTVTMVGSLYASLRLSELSRQDVDFIGDVATVTKLQEVAARRGRPGLVEWLDQNRRPLPGRVVLVFDESCRELLQRPTPWGISFLMTTEPQFGDRPIDRPPVDRPAGEPGARPFRPPRGRGGRGCFGALQAPIVGSNSERYSYLFADAPSELLGLIIWPGTQVTVFGIALLAAVATALSLALYLSSPILRLQKASRALAAGALDTRVGPVVGGRKDEVGRLARDFDRMAERIQALVTDKETLLRDVSHELRSPLARIRVALALAQRKSAETAQNDLARIELETEKLDGLVGQVMKLSRLRTATEPSRKPVDLQQLVESVVEDARFEHPGRVVNLTAPTPIHLTGDPDGLKSAVENVLRNALAYSPADKPIDVTVAWAARNIEIRIRDRGPGVEPIHLKRIFEPFYRTDESRDHRQDGQGIGLAITARVMELHGGSVEAANCADGGLQITLSLPNEPLGADKPRRKQDSKQD